MAIIHHKPVTPSTRFYTRNKAEVTDKRPERSLTKGHHRKKGRNSYGRITFPASRRWAQKALSHYRLPPADHRCTGYGRSY